MTCVSTMPVRFGPAPHYRGENAVRETSISVSSGVRRGKNLAAFRNKLSGLCIDAGNGTKNNGTKKTGAAVFQAPCAERASQALKIRPLSANGNNMHFKIHAGHSDLCLQLTGDAKHGSRLIQARCDSKKTNQKFCFRR